MGRRPASFKELFEFYYETVKPLYSTVQLTNELPVEVLFELNAALDHVSRHWAYGETEADVSDKAYAHLKRSCLDIFKLRLKDAIDQFRQLRNIDTSIIDNGEFDRRLINLMAEIKAGARDARAKEGNTQEDDEQAIYAFELWSPVYANCVSLEKDFFNNQHVDWARKKESRSKWVERGYGFVLGVISSIIASFIYACVMDGCSQKQEPKPSTRPATQPTTMATRSDFFGQG
jgi:hypothetical protein